MGWKVEKTLLVADWRKRSETFRATLRAGGWIEVGEAEYSWVDDCAREEGSLMAHLEWP